MTDIERALLFGLQQFGRTKTFKEILELAGVSADDNSRLEAAYSLEGNGLIQAVSYQLPISLRAELSSKGKELLRSLRQAGDQSGGSLKALLKFLQFNPLFL